MTDAYITTVNDLVAWVENENPGNVLTCVPDMHATAQRYADIIRDAPDRPAWGTDWSEWLDANAERLVLAL